MAKTQGMRSSFKLCRTQREPNTDVLYRGYVRAKDAVAAMIKRLAHRNANVQLYTLEVCA